MEKESTIREVIAKNIGSLDKKLKLVAQEHYISMPDGIKAYVDILAKDEFGCFTIIELKKSNQTARSAIQQLYKYASFLKRKNRLEESQIRCIILSTVWEELEAPFSEFERFSDYEVKGYQVHYTPDQIPSFTEIVPTYQKGNIKPLDNFIFFEFNLPCERDAVFKKLEDIFKKCPSINSVLIKANYKGEMNDIIHPFGFSWTMFTGDIERIRSDISSLADTSSGEHNFSPEVLVNMWEHDGPEYKIRTEILLNHIRIKEGAGEYSSFALHTLNNTLATWKHENPKAFGVMFDDFLFDSDDFLSMSLGQTGQHPYNFVIKTTPSRPKQHLMVRDNLNQFLSTNKRWRRQVNYILQTLEDSDVAIIAIYNPLNLFGMINDNYKTGSSQRIPSLKIRIEKPKEITEDYYGALFWRKRIDEPQNPKIAIENSYPSLDIFRMRSVMQKITEYDESLSEQYGLTYDILSISNGGSKFIEEIEGDEVQENRISNLQDFLDSHDSLIDEVGALF